jgi:hypothetical protein
MIAPDFGPDSRRGKGRRVVLCNPFRNAEAGPKDKQDWINIFSAALNSLLGGSSHCIQSGGSISAHRPRRRLLPPPHGSVLKTDLLILDDWGIQKLTGPQRHDLMEVIEDRHGRRSTQIAGHQLPVEHWHEYLGDATLADATLDWLLHGAYRIALRGESMRRSVTIRGITGHVHGNAHPAIGSQGRGREASQCETLRHTLLRSTKTSGPSC